jgi:hypothetical protein
MLVEPKVKGRQDRNVGNVLGESHAKTQRLSAAEPQPKMTTVSACRRRGVNGAAEALWYARRIFQKMNDFERLHC